MIHKKKFDEAHKNPKMGYLALAFGLGLALTKLVPKALNDVYANKTGLETKVVQVVENNDEGGLDYKIESVNEPNEVPIKYTSQDYEDMQNILYAEAANQSKNMRKLIARVILNRVESREYPPNIHDVIFQRNAFSCINDKKNKNWKQATGESKKNEYEEMIYKICGEDAKTILNGEKLGFPCENKLIAYHDNSVRYEDLVTKELELKKKYEKEEKIYKGYWINLKPIFSIDRFTFYVQKKNL